MTFDDHLKRAFDTMSERLHAEVDRQVDTVLAELAAAAHAEREGAVANARDDAAREAAARFEAVVAATREEAHSHGLAAGRDQGHREGLEEGRQRGLEEGSRQGLEDGRRRGLDEGRQQGLEEGRQRGFEAGQEQGVLEGRQQAEQAHREALDAAVAVARGERAVDAGGTERLSASVRALGDAKSLSEILDTLVRCAAPDSGHAGLWVVRSGALHRWRSTGDDGAEAHLPLDDPGPIAAAVRNNGVVAMDGTVAAPIAMAGQVVAVLSANSGAPGAVEILARYAARCLEALTAFKAARALSERPGDRLAEAAAAGGDATLEEDASARRYARLLVSEIKLYHEAAVVDGRRERNLGARLGGEIARARVLYEQRVPPQVRQRADYFHDEVVRTLANGDASLLQLR
jgi:hypothetical protein